MTDSMDQHRTKSAGHPGGGIELKECPRFEKGQTTESPTRGEEHLHLYCVKLVPNGPENLGPIGIGDRGDEVCTVVRDGIGMVVSRSPKIPFAEIPPEQALRHLAAHQTVVEQAMKESAVLPVKFGTYAADEREVLQILQDNRQGLKQLLERFMERIELDLVVSWPDLGPIFREIAQEEAIQEMKAEIASLPPDSEEAFPKKIAMGQLVKERLELRRKALAEEILAELQDIAEDLSQNHLKDDSMILNAALLLEQSAGQLLNSKFRAPDMG